MITSPQLISTRHGESLQMLRTHSQAINESQPVNTHATWQNYALHHSYNELLHAELPGGPQSQLDCTQSDELLNWHTDKCQTVDINLTTQPSTRTKRKPTESTHSHSWHLLSKYERTIYTARMDNQSAITAIAHLGENPPRAYRERGVIRQIRVYRLCGRNHYM